MSGHGGLVGGPIDREMRLDPGECVLPSWMLDRYCEALTFVSEVDRRRLREGEWTEDVGGET